MRKRICRRILDGCPYVFLFKFGTRRRAFVNRVLKWLEEQTYA